MYLMLSTRSATALYVGAVLGPGVTYLPALAARTAGPASLLAWIGLLLLSVPLGGRVRRARHPSSRRGRDGVLRAHRVRRARRPRDRLVVPDRRGRRRARGGLIGGFYVAELVGGGRETAVAAAAVMIAIVIAANAASLRTTARLQLVLAAVLAALLLVASLAALPHGSAERWTPFAPHGWSAIGTAATVLMFSFFGWEAGSHLVGDLRDPRRQLPRALAGALAVIVVLYLRLAVATIGIDTSSDVPLADLMAAGLGAPRAHHHRRARRAADRRRDEHLRGRRRAAVRRRSPPRARVSPLLRSRSSRPSCWCRWRSTCSTSTR